MSTATLTDPKPASTQTTDERIVALIGEYWHTMSEANKYPCARPAHDEVTRELHDTLTDYAPALGRGCTGVVYESWVYSTRMGRVVAQMIHPIKKEHPHVS